MSELIASLPVCSQSVRAVAILAKKEAKLPDNIVKVCVNVCVLPGKASAWHTILQAAP